MPTSITLIVSSEMLSPLSEICQDRGGDPPRNSYRTFTPNPTIHQSDQGQVQEIQLLLTLLNCVTNPAVIYFTGLMWTMTGRLFLCVGLVAGRLLRRVLKVSLLSTHPVCVSKLKSSFICNSWSMSLPKTITISITILTMSVPLLLAVKVVHTLSPFLVFDQTGSKYHLFYVTCAFISSL